MRPLEALDAIVDESKFSKASLSRELGKNHSYVASYALRGIIPRVDTFARIIDPCGYQLVARNRESGKEIVIDHDYDDPTKT